MIEPRQLFNFIQGSDITGESSYDLWKRLGNEGTEADFLEFIRSGPKGENGCVYALSASELVIKKSINNVLLPGNITFTSYYRIGTNVNRYDYAGRFVVQETSDGDTWYTKYTSSQDEVSIIYTPSNSNVKIIRCTLYASGGTTVEIDTQTVVILEDVSSIEVGARNLLRNSDIYYEIDKYSSNISLDLPISNNFDLQSLIGKTVTLSYYADTMGGYTGTGIFGISSTIIWSHSDGSAISYATNPITMNSTGVYKQRVSQTVTITPPSDKYDMIENITINIMLSLKPSNINDVWIFAHPKLEIGNVATDWTLAPEDIEDFASMSGLTEHTSSTNNPHNVTKSQVGLGNVPNVATNDQTPTYTESNALSSLTSGEKLSVAFGKIAKSISDFIIHLANKSNPHSVTAAQLGALTSADIVDNLESTSTILPLSSNQGNKIKTSLDSKAPISHASSGTTYGKGTDSVYGHLKLSDSIVSISDATGGYASTPKAIHRVKGLITKACVMITGDTGSVTIPAGTITKIKLSTFTYKGYGYDRDGDLYTFSINSDGGVVCPVSGTVLVTGSVSLTGTAGTERSKGCYITHYSNSTGIYTETQVCSQYIREMGGTGGISSGMNFVSVRDGDVFYLNARSSSECTCYTNNNATYLSITYLSIES